jgi:hypothetical protein
MSILGVRELAHAFDGAGRVEYAGARQSEGHPRQSGGKPPHSIPILECGSLLTLSTSGLMRVGWHPEIRRPCRPKRRQASALHIRFGVRELAAAFDARARGPCRRALVFRSLFRITKSQVARMQGGAQHNLAIESAVPMYRVSPSHGRASKPEGAGAVAISPDPPGISPPISLPAPVAVFKHFFLKKRPASIKYLTNRLRSRARKGRLSSCLERARY